MQSWSVQTLAGTCRELMRKLNLALKLLVILIVLKWFERFVKLLERM